MYIKKELLQSCKYCGKQTGSTMRKYHKECLPPPPKPKGTWAEYRALPARDRMLHSFAEYQEMVRRQNESS